MKFKITSMLALNLMSVTIFCMDRHQIWFSGGTFITASGHNAQPVRNSVPESESEKVLRDSLSNVYGEPWEATKSKLTDVIINKGVTTLDVCRYGQDGATPLKVALEAEDLEFAGLLLARGAGANFGTPIFSAKSLAALKLLKAHGADLTKLDSSADNLLHIATNGWNQDDDLFDYLIEQGLDHKISHKFGGTIWHRLIGSDIKPEHFIHRAEKLKALVSPYEKGAPGPWGTVTPIEQFEDKLRAEAEYVATLPEDAENKAFRIERLEAWKKCLEFMKQCPKASKE